MMIQLQLSDFKISLAIGHPLYRTHILENEFKKMTISDIKKTGSHLVFLFKI